jgi:hypothetical protein
VKEADGGEDGKKPIELVEIDVDGEERGEEACRMNLG